ncbi:uncharacterized protein UTRI_10189 [Ustilago trichophora]|uniref:Uncharacterized protein n=1 Tax=Ustilago trichophora TaxID=86804 RepID=A0A5C3ED56_9BASI|nr:uncharacterized protein UTRI_10189 [Ustilago trichophora]
MYSHPNKLIFVVLVLATITRAAAIGSNTFRKRMLATDVSSEKDRIPFEQLRSDFFQHNPRLAQAFSSSVLEQFSDTFFFKKKPVFQAYPQFGVSQSRLRHAYDSFGKVHVSNAEQSRFLTIEPKYRFPSGVKAADDQKLAHDVLASFVRRKEFIKEHFGNDAALVTYGWDLTPTRKAKFGLGHPRDALRDMSAGTSYTVIRKRLSEEGWAVLASRSGKSRLRLVLQPQGSIHPSVFGELKSAAQELHI